MVVVVGAAMQWVRLLHIVWASCMFTGLSPGCSTLIQLPAGASGKAVEDRSLYTQGTPGTFWLLALAYEHLRNESVNEKILPVFKMSKNSY